MSNRTQFTNELRKTYPLYKKGSRDAMILKRNGLLAHMARLFMWKWKAALA